VVDPNTRQGKRTPVTLKIKFKSETLEQFIERYAVDVSQGGIFIRTKEPLAVGTQMKFEFQLRDASPLIAGEGTVVWTRENDPSRPAIAPGMGVRFDRLADGSQSVLERILSEKAKQAPQRPLKDTTKPPLFTDTPTRVAPAPMQEALLGRNSSPAMSRTRSGDQDEKTPLPKPMPFHSDADDFSEEAFEEATKVRALDELVAQTALAEPSRTPPSTPPSSPSNDELAARRTPTPTPVGMPVDRESAPTLPSPPEARPAPKVLDTTPSPRSEPSPSTPPANKTRLGLEAPVQKSPSQPPVDAGPRLGMPAGSDPRPAVKDAVTVPSGVHAIRPPEEKAAASSGSLPATAQRLPTAKRPSSAPIIVGIILVVAAAGAALWFFVLRETAMDPIVVKKAGSGSNLVTTPGSGSDAIVTPGGSAELPGSGSAGSNQMATDGSGSGSAETPKGDVVDTAISVASDIKNATIEVVGTDQKGPAPLTAKLAKGKAYKARITAPGYLAGEYDVKGGEKLAGQKLDAKKYIVTVTSDPPGAAVAIDGVVGKNPYELKNPPKKAVRLTIGKAGYRQVAVTIDAAKWNETETTMTYAHEAKLVAAPTYVPPTQGSGSAKDAGSGEPPPDPGSGSAPPPPPDEPAPSF